MNDAAFRNANLEWEDANLARYLKTLDDLEQRALYEDAIQERIDELLYAPKSREEEKEVEHAIAKAAKSYTFAAAVLALMAARPLLKNYSELEHLIDAADEAEKDVRLTLEKALRGGTLY